MKTKSNWQVGKNYFIRTVTYFYTGRLKRVTKNELVLTDAAWIADTGRFSEFLKTGAPKEVEPYPDGLEVVISRGGIIDGNLWSHSLPREVK